MRRLAVEGIEYAPCWARPVNNRLWNSGELCYQYGDGCKGSFQESEQHYKKMTQVCVSKSFIDHRELSRTVAKQYALSDVRCQLITATMRDVYLDTRRC